MRIAKRAWLVLRAQAVSQWQSPEEIARSIAAQYFANIRDIRLIARAGRRSRATRTLRSGGAQARCREVCLRHHWTPNCAALIELIGSCLIARPQSSDGSQSRSLIRAFALSRGLIALHQQGSNRHGTLPMVHESRSSGITIVLQTRCLACQHNESYQLGG
jgi:hypothetical protein